MEDAAASHHLDCALIREHSGLAIQPQLGILSEWRVGIDCARSGHPAVNGSNIGPRGWPAFLTGFRLASRQKTVEKSRLRLDPELHSIAIASIHAQM